MLKQKVLDFLEQQRGNLVTGGHLAALFGVSRNAIWKTIHALQNEGNEIASLHNKGYILMDTNDTLSEKLIRDRLTTNYIGHQMALLSTIHSTNQYLKELDVTTVDNGFVVVADEQTNGRGRRGRVFVSTKHEGIFLSILLKLDRAWQDMRLLTIYTAVAVSRAIEDVCGIKADIKWVNDVFYNEKKLCGILTEAVLSGELQELSTIIVGIGINTGIIPPELNGVATSVLEATGRRGVRNRLIAEVLNQFEAVCIDYTKRGGQQSIIDYYQSRLFITGREILVTDTDRDYVATVLGIDETGALMVRDGNNETKYITTGEIKLKW